MPPVEGPLFWRHVGSTSPFVQRFESRGQRGSFTTTFFHTYFYITKTPFRFCAYHTVSNVTLCTHQFLDMVPSI